jgi:eukaryotic-like serine/threonine-protein kinase
MGDLPVGGISWYEAMAYAEFAGKSLPTVYEWFAAAAISGLIDPVVGNFGGIGPTKVGENASMTRFGTVDMAGNVKEWAVNPSEQGRYLLGGAWNEDAYVFSVPDPRSPFAREATFGLRLVRRVAAVPEGTSGPLVTFANRAFSLSAPVDDRLYETFLALHAYDKTDLDARVERIDESSPHWRRETVTFRAAYGNERVIAHLFLPRESKPPYQVVIVFGGSTIMQLRRVDDIEYPYQFLIRAGRAVLIPAYSGTLERGPSPLRLPVNQERERALKWSKDLGRSIDYVATRADVDVQRLALYALSWGGAHAPRLLAVEKRLKTGVLSSAGLLAAQPPETDAWNFAPRVRVPVLMLNGRDDFAVPYETRQRPLFEALGSNVKVFSRYEGGHGNLTTHPNLIGEILDWLDKHLGPLVPRT